MSHHFLLFQEHLCTTRGTYCRAPSLPSLPDVKVTGFAGEQSSPVVGRWVSYGCHRLYRLKNASNGVAVVIAQPWLHLPTTDITRAVRVGNHIFNEDSFHSSILFTIIIIRLLLSIHRSLLPFLMIMFSSIVSEFS